MKMMLEFASIGSLSINFVSTCMPWLRGWKNFPFYAEFSCHRSSFVCLLTAWIYRIWPLIFLTKNFYFTKKCLHLTSFFYHFLHPITLLFQILGGQMHGPSPPQILGRSSPSPPKSHAWIVGRCYFDEAILTGLFWLDYFNGSILAGLYCHGLVCLRVNLLGLFWRV